jgi:chorismate mutase/prephenate dehydratase
MFYFDMDASIYSPDVINLLCQLSGSLETFVFLGSYSEV